MRNSLLIIPIFFTLFSSCEKNQFNAETPSYLHISGIDLQVNGTQGSDSQKITDAWVTMDGTFLGAFELPCTVPILADGAHEFSIYAGIKANGISATRIRYPFYDKCKLFQGTDSLSSSFANQTITLYKDSTISINGTTMYKENTAFIFIENFEDAGVILEASSDSDTILSKINTDSLVFEGYGSGVIVLDTVHDFFEIMNSEFISLGSIYNQTLLELDYKCDHSFKIGVVVKSAETGSINRYESLHIDSTSVWNKIYVHMTNQVNLGNSEDEFGIFIGMQKRQDMENTTFYFDNIKWHHEE